ncbi:MAG: hypothetical protein IKU10_04390 [Clostridia bacterium]|nr:hypothetical protein [Clostridia bacterium]
MTFFENTKTPKSMADCVAIDPTAGSLSAWATRLKLIAKIIFFLFAGISVFLLFISLIVFFDDEDMAGIIAITAGSIVVSGFLEYSILWTLATLIQALACLVQNTKVTAMVAIYQTGEELPKETQVATPPKKPKPQPKPQPEPKDDSAYHIGQIPIHITAQTKGKWICPVCCRENPASKTVCACDYVRQESDTVHPTSTTAKPKAKPTYDDELVESLPDTAWQCPACGLILPKDKEKCSCGYKKQ